MALISQSCPILLEACLFLSGTWSDESVQFSNTLGRHHPTDPHVFFSFLSILLCQYSSSLLLKVLQPQSNLMGKCHRWIRDTQDQRPACVATKMCRTKDPKNLDHQYHPHHTHDTSPRCSSAPRYAQHLCIHNAAPKRHREVSNVKSFFIRRKGRYIGTNMLYKCHIGLCTPRRTIMESKKKKGPLAHTVRS